VRARQGRGAWFGRVVRCALAGAHGFLGTALDPELFEPCGGLFTPL
jgi:hypothetical protein